MDRIHKLFDKWAGKVAVWVGHPTCFMIAAVLVIAWGISGPFFGYSDTWELIINTATTIITFLMVFLIQNTQNRDARAIHLKLDELILAIAEANNQMINCESMSEKELEALAEKYKGLAEKAEDMRRHKKRHGHHHHHH